MNHAPWTDIGAIQSEIRNIQNILHNKANTYETHSFSNRLDALERSIGHLSARVDEVIFRLQKIEETQLNLTDDGTK